MDECPEAVDASLELLTQLARIAVGARHIVVDLPSPPTACMRVACRPTPDLRKCSAAGAAQRLFP